jgi:hypothetical protein
LSFSGTFTHLIFHKAHLQLLGVTAPEWRGKTSQSIDHEHLKRKEGNRAHEQDKVPDAVVLLMGAVALL